MGYWLGLTIILLGVVLGIQNADITTLTWFSWSWSLPLAVWLLLTFVIGMLIGWLINPWQRFFRKKS